MLLSLKHLLTCSPALHTNIFSLFIFHSILLFALEFEDGIQGQKGYIIFCLPLRRLSPPSSLQSPVMLL